MRTAISTEGLTAAALLVTHPRVSKPIAKARGFLTLLFALVEVCRRGVASVKYAHPIFPCTIYIQHRCLL